MALWEWIKLATGRKGKAGDRRWGCTVAGSRERREVVPLVDGDELGLLSHRPPPPHGCCLSALAMLDAASGHALTFAGLWSADLTSTIDLSLLSPSSLTKPIPNLSFIAATAASPFTAPTAGSMSTVGDLRSFATSHLDSLKRHLDMRSTVTPSMTSRPPIPVSPSAQIIRCRVACSWWPEEADLKHKEDGQQVRRARASAC